MPSKTDHTAKINRLNDLAAKPDEQVLYAAALLDDRNELVLRAALQVLTDHPRPQLRPKLLAQYDHYDANGIKRDPSGYARAAIIKTLQQVARREDIALFERAATTYEFLPPSRDESTAMIRAAGLVALDALDTVLAGFHAARLLLDPYTMMMSGEPAATAVRVLADQGQTLPLYAYAINYDVLAEPHRRPEIVSECLRHLQRLPPSLLPPLVEKIRAANNELMLVGLFDLLLNHPARAEWLPLVWEFLRSTRSYSLHRFLVTTIVAGRERDLLHELMAIAQDEQDQTKTQNLRDAFALMRGDPAIDQWVRQLNA